MSRFVARFTTSSPTVRLIVKRLLLAIPVVVGVTFLTFALMNLLPGGSALAIAGPTATKQQIADISIRLHLNEPFLIRYWHWFTQAAIGHFGASLQSGEPVSTIVGTRLPVTAEMVILAFIFSVGLSIPVAVLAAHKPRGIADRISIIVSATGMALPGFVLGLLLAIVFAVHLRLLPSLGFTPLSDGLWPNLKTMLLPSITLGFSLFCHYTRVLRADLIDLLYGEDYILTAYSKGLSTIRILFVHALRNSLFNLLTLVGLNLGVLFGGTVLIEEIFAIPGVGQALIQAIEVQDVVVVEAIVVVLSVAVVLTSLITDLLYSVLDPRIRYDRTRD
jgi:peptide/nickel transport system permease protein